MTDREAAWTEILDHLPPGWRVTQPRYDPSRLCWEVVARSPNRGGRRAAPPDYIIGEGTDEPAALRDLAAKLDGD